MPPLYNSYEAKNIINVLHSKLVKKKKKENDLTILGDLPLLKKIGLLSRATYPHTHWSIFMGDLPTHSHWSIFMGDLPTLTGLFLWATYPHIHIGLFSWATCPQTHSGLFSRATCPLMIILVYFQGRPAHILTLVYFHGQPAHTCSSWSTFRGDRPTHSH